ncbi:MAG: DUF6379 domain-containing protein [Bryobacteraceae bacterium]
MWEDDLVPILGFKNVTRDSRVVGFQVNLRPNDQKWTGEYACSIQAIDLTVDGEKIAPDRMMVSIGSRTFMFNDLENATDVRRAPSEVYTVTVSKPGGLTPGMHSIQASVRIRGGGMRNDSIYPWGAGARGGRGGANAGPGSGGPGGGVVKRNMTLVL